MSSKHDETDAGSESEFSNCTPPSLVPGDVIVERSERGKVIHRAKVTSVNLAPSGCTGKTHVTVVGGTEWCYENGTRIETE